MLDLERINDLYAEQFRTWPDVKKRYDALMQTRRRIIGLDDMSIGLQCNPGRVRSTAAETDASSLAKRPCFLCHANRPTEQINADILPGWDWLINPYPIFPVHFTIVSKAHEPQEETPLDMVAAADKAPGLVFFYNGARAGASAPDHLHFQATVQEELPLLGIVERYHEATESSIKLSTDLPLKLPINFYSLCILPDMEGMQLLGMLPKIYGYDAETGAPDPGMVNVLVWLDARRILRAVVIPRRRHRPDCYYASGESQLLVSPGAIDMAGLIILPREEDYERITVEDVKAIYSQCGLTAEELRKNLRMEA